MIPAYHSLRLHEAYGGNSTMIRFVLQVLSRTTVSLFVLLLSALDYSLRLHEAYGGNSTMVCFVLLLLSCYHSLHCSVPRVKYSRLVLLLLSRTT